jgi:hypothetical protein
MLAVHYANISSLNPHGFVERDSFAYDRLGWHIAQHWRHGHSTRIEYQTIGFTVAFHYTVAAVYAVAGHVPLLVKTLIVLISASLIPLTFLLGRRVGGPRVGFIAAFLMVIWPPVIQWSVQLLKDIPITFLLLLAVHGWVAFHRRPRFLSLAGAILPAVPLIFLRTYMFPFWVAGIAAGLFAMGVQRGHRLLAVVWVGAVGAFGWWAVSTYSSIHLEDLESLITKLDAIGTIQGSLFHGVGYRSSTDLVTFLPLGFLRFLLTPLPWKSGQWAEALGSILRYALLPFVACGIVHLWRRERIAILPIVVCGLLTISIYALAFRGGSPRHWVQLYPYFFVFAAAGLPRFPGWPVPMAFVWSAFMVAAFVTWSQDLQSVFYWVVPVYIALSVAALRRRDQASRHAAPAPGRG